MRQHKDLKTSQGIQLKEKIVEFYEQVLFHGKDPQTYPFAFLLLKPNTNALQTAIDNLTQAQIQQKAHIFRYIFRQCSKALPLFVEEQKEHHPNSKLVAFENALETMYTLLYSFSVKKITNSSNIFELICGLEEAERFFEHFFARLQKVLEHGSLVQLGYQTYNSLLKLLLVLVSYSSNLHSNIFTDFLQQKDIFFSCLHFRKQIMILPHEENAAKQSLLSKIMVFIVISLHYRRYESQNAYVHWITSEDCTKSDIASLNENILELFEFSKGLYSTTLFEEASTSFSSIISSVASYLNFQGPDEQELHQIELLHDYRWTMALLPSIMLYHVVHLHSKYMIYSAELKRRHVSDVDRKFDEEMVVPTEHPIAVDAFMSFASLLMSLKDSEYAAEIGLLPRLFFLIFRVMSEDPASLVVLHDRYDRNNKKSKTDPMICALLSISTCYIAKHTTQGAAFEMVHVLNLKLILENTYRFIKYGLETNLISWPQNPTSIQHSYLSLARALLKLLIRWGSVAFKAIRTQIEGKVEDDDGNLQTLSHTDELLAVLGQTSSILQMMCDISMVIFANIRYESQFLWDLVQQNNRLLALRDLAYDFERMYEDTLSETEFISISQIAAKLKLLTELTTPMSFRFDSYIELRWKGRLSKDQLSIKQVLYILLHNLMIILQKVEVIENAKVSLDVHQPQNYTLPSYIRYAENPKEVLFFNHISSLLLRKYVYLSIDSYASATLSSE